MTIFKYSSPKYTVFNLIPKSAATSLRLCPHPLPQSKSQNGVLIETASTSTSCSCIILTAKLLSNPPDNNATAFFFCTLVSFVCTDYSTPVLGNERYIIILVIYNNLQYRILWSTVRISIWLQ